MRRDPFRPLLTLWGNCPGIRPALASCGDFEGGFHASLFILPRNPRSKKEEEFSDSLWQIPGGITVLPGGGRRVATGAGEGF